MGFLKSSIGKKYLMGVAGLVWAGFVAGHMAGNLLIFAGPRAFNSYAHAIVTNKILLYGTEIVLSLSLLTHVTLGLILSLENRRASPQKYQVLSPPQKRARWASRTMGFQGSLILCFIIYHLITFKYGPYYRVMYEGEEMRDLYRLVLEVFQNPLYVTGYVVCLILLGFHLSHGFSSAFQSFGLGHPSYGALVEKVGWIYAFIVSVGFISQPLYVFTFYVFGFSMG